MRESWRVLLALTALVLGLRLVTMAIFPLVETTEPRYAEISRLMAQTGDWITPWFSESQPFWGKPPLSFWSQALAIQWLGDTVLSVRLPSWLAMIGSLLLVLKLATRQGGPRLGAWSAAVFITMVLPYVSAGAVMTDAYLTLGVTLSLVSLLLVLEGERGLWRWLFFVGLAVALLAKGPIGLVLVGLPLGLWSLTGRYWRLIWRTLPWLRGSLLTVLLTLPWYIAAELKTPGFLDYFLLGEHLYRFTDPGWEGDLYGSAHEEPRGMIWLFWLGATFPWGLVVLCRFFGDLARSRRWALCRWLSQSPQFSLMVWASVGPMLFFTLSGNILWTYVLPALPTTAILFARYLFGQEQRVTWARRLPFALTPVVMLIAGLALPWYERSLNTEAPVVAAYQKAQVNHSGPLYYLGQAPFSARYYSEGQARGISTSALRSQLNQSDVQPVYLAVPKKNMDKLESFSGRSSVILSESKRHRLLMFGGAENLSYAGHTTDVGTR